MYGIAATDEQLVLKRILFHAEENTQELVGAHQKKMKRQCAGQVKWSGAGPYLRPPCVAQHCTLVATIQHDNTIVNTCRGQCIL